MLDRFTRWTTDPSSDDPDSWRTEFGFAIPDERALELIANQSPNGIVEVGAGLGYWARLLHERGSTVTAYDIAPPPSERNRWFAGRTPWFPVLHGDESSVDAHPHQTLLIIWPTRDEVWPALAASRHLAGGGKSLIYVGEPPGGSTGDLHFHTVLGLMGRCLPCAFGVTSAPCTCSIPARWSLRTQMLLPRSGDQDDHVFVFGPPEERRVRSRWRKPKSASIDT